MAHVPGNAAALFFPASAEFAGVVSIGLVCWAGRTGFPRVRVLALSPSPSLCSNAIAIVSLLEVLKCERASKLCARGLASACPDVIVVLSPGPNSARKHGGPWQDIIYLEASPGNVARCLLAVVPLSGISADRRSQHSPDSRAWIGKRREERGYCSRDMTCQDHQKLGRCAEVSATVRIKWYVDRPARGIREA